MRMRHAPGLRTVGVVKAVKDLVAFAGQIADRYAPLRLLAAERLKSQVGSEELAV
jgi:hypothetical protein